MPTLCFSRAPDFRRTAVPCRLHLVALTLVLLITGCTEPVCCGPSPTPTPNPDPLSQTIGPAGGRLVSADSAFSLTVPAGALAAPTAMTVKVVADSAPYGVGKVYQLSPAGIRFTKPVSVSIAIDSAVVGGVSVPPEGLVVALGDTAGTWLGILDSELEPAPTLSVRGTVLATSGSGAAAVAATINPVEEEDLAPLPTRYAVISYWYVDPKSARVRVTEAVSIRVLVCARQVEVDLSRFARIVQVVPPSRQFPAPPDDCIPSARTGTWFVNGLRGGNSTLGFVAAGGNGAPSSLAEFTAPQTVPSPSTVTVRADMLWPARQVTRKFSVPVTIYDDWVGTTSWKSSGGVVKTYLNGSLSIEYLAQGSARFSSRRTPFGAITERGGVLPADAVNTTYELTRVETSQSSDGRCSIDIVDRSVTRGGLNGPPPAGVLSDLWLFVITLRSDNTYVLGGGISLVPVTTVTTVTTTRACPGVATVTTTTTDSKSDYAPAATIPGAVNEVRSFLPGEKRLEGRIEKVDDLGLYVVTSEFKWDITRP
jgi:ZU5 domain